FRATLEEVIEADLLLHVIDIAHPGMEEQIEAVRRTIRDLDLESKPVLHVLNKMDLIEFDPLVLQSFRNQLGEVVAVSAQTGEGQETLIDKIVVMLGRYWERVHLSIPLDQQSLISTLHDQGKIYSKSYVDGRIELDVEIPKKLAEKVRSYGHAR
ncbi:MAG TPA: GTPase HflX, partial [Acidobacteriota bacterium]|nr:GTPase HflX [Acidobacteriota bacterium]